MGWVPRPRPDADSGVVALLAVALLVGMLGLAAIVVDLGNARDLDRQAQNAADAGALAAAQFMAGPGSPDPAQAVVVGQRYIDANGWDGGASSVRVDPVAGTVDVVLAPRQAPRFFAGVVGGGTPTVGASAQARWLGGGAALCALCVIGDYDGQVGSAVVVRGSVAVGGALTFASAQGRLSVSPPGSGSIGYYGSYDGGGSPQPTPVKLADPVTDPFRALNLQAPPEADPAVVAKVGSGTCAPGVYADVTRCTAFTGNGTYVVTGSPGTRTVEINADARNSLFYVTCYSYDRGARQVHYAPCSSGAPPAQLAGAGRADASISAPASGTYRGFAVMWDRGMVCDYPSCRQSLVGNATLTVDGVVYGPSISFGAAGNGYLTVRGTVVVGEVHLAGVGVGAEHITVDATSASAPPVLPPAPVRLTR